MGGPGIEQLSPINGPKKKAGWVLHCLSSRCSAYIPEYSDACSAVPQKAEVVFMLSAAGCDPHGYIRELHLIEGNSTAHMHFGDVLNGPRPPVHRDRSLFSLKLLTCDTQRTGICSHYCHKLLETCSVSQY